MSLHGNRRKKRTSAFRAALARALVGQKGRGFGTLGAIAGAANMAALKKGLKRRRR